MVIRADVVVKGKVPETRETYVWVPRRNQICCTEVGEIGCIGEKLNSAGYFTLVHEELHLLEVDKAGELQNDLLRVHTKPLRLPAYQLTLILV